MPLSDTQLELLLQEHHTLIRSYGHVQITCTEQLRLQAMEIECMQAEMMRMRATLIVRETALLWERQARNELEQAMPGLATRVALNKRVDELLMRVQDLMRVEMSTHQEVVQVNAPVQVVDADALEASLKAADLVICQTGCLSHGSYWRVQDHCKRTGKTCVLVEQADALRIVRINEALDGDGTSITELTQEV